MNVELIQSILFFLTGGFLLFLAITIIRDNIFNRLNRITGAMLFFVGLGPLFVALGWFIRQSVSASIDFEDSTLFNLQFMWEFFFPFLLLFSWIFPEDRIREFKHPRLRYMIFVPQILDLLLVLFFDQLTGILDYFRVDPDAGGLSGLILSPLSRFFTLVLVGLSFIRTYQIAIFGSLNILYVVLAIYFLESGRKEVTNPRLLTQTRIVFRGLRISIGLYIVTFLGMLVLPGIFTETVAATLLLLSAVVLVVTFSNATIRHQFLDVRLHFRQSFVYTITSALLVGAYILLVTQSKRFLEPVFGAQAEVVSYVFIIVLLLLFQPVNNSLDNLIRSLFIRTKTDHRNVIERFSKQVISLFDPVRLRQIIEETFKTSLMVDRVYFVLYDDEIEEYAILKSNDFPRRVPLERNDLLLRGINLLDSPTYLSTLSDYMEDSNLARHLRERQVKLVLPLKDADHLLGFLALTEKVAGYRYSLEDLNILGVLTNQMVTALTNARLYVDSLERIRLEEEVTMARQIQLNLLPANPPVVETIEIAVHSTPSRTVGGDFYDFVRIDDRKIGIVIADASGKGMPAALMIAQIQAIIHSEVNNGNRIDKMLRNMNQLVVQATSSEKYVTLFYGELDTTTGEFYYCNAGHNYPILVRSQGEVELLKVGGPVIGALTHMEYEATSVRLNSDDLLFLFTDGLSEAMDAEEHEYGEERICRLICEHRRDNAQAIMDAILEDVHKFDPTNPPRDDTTIISLKLNNKLVPYE